MIENLITALKNEQVEGTSNAREMVERLDRHIRDLQTFREWILDSAAVRAAAIDGLIGAPPDAPHD